MKLKLLILSIILIVYSGCRKSPNYSKRSLKRNISNRSYNNKIQKAKRLYDRGKYRNSFELLSKVPESYSKIEVIYWKGKCLEKLKQNKKAIKTFEKIFNVKDNRRKLKGFAYFSYLDIFSKYDDISNISAFKIDKIKRYFNNNHIMKKKTLKKISSYYEYKFYKSIYQKNYFMMENNYKLFLKNSNPKLWMYENEFGKRDYRTFINALKFWDLKKFARNRAFKHKIKVLYFKYLNTNQMNKNMREKELLSSSEIRDYKKVFEVMKKFYYYISNGKLLLEFDHSTVKSTIKNFRVEYYRSRFERYKFYRFDVDDITPYPSRTFRNSYKNCDSYIFITPTKNIRTSFATKNYVNITRSRRSRAKKGIMVFGSIRSKNPITLIHEFFHIVEETFNIKPIHSFKDSFKTVWPRWYNGEGQLHFYEQMFRRSFNKLNFKRMRFR